MKGEKIGRRPGEIFEGQDGMRLLERFCDLLEEREEQEKYFLELALPQAMSPVLPRETVVSSVEAWRPNRIRRDMQLNQEKDEAEERQPEDEKAGLQIDPEFWRELESYLEQSILEELSSSARGVY